MSGVVPQYPWADGDHLFASALNAAFKNGAAIGGPFLLLAGGTVTGPTTFSTTITTAASAPPILQTVWNVANTDGAGTTVQFSTENIINVSAPIGQSIWGNSDVINYTSPTPSTTTSSLVARRALTYATTNRGTAPGAPGLWAGIFDIVDTTGHPSSVAGQMLCLELDIEAGGLDDAENRQGLVVVGTTRNYPTVPSSEFSRAIGVFTQSGAVFKDQLTLWGQFNRAGINFTQAVSVGGAPHIWLTGGQSIAFDGAKNMRLMWSTVTNKIEWHWLGNTIWTLDPSGTTAIGGLTVATSATFNGGINLSGHPLAWDAAATAEAYWDSAAFSGAGGVTLNTSLTVGGTLLGAGNTTLASAVVTGATTLDGNVGFHGTLPIAKPTVSGAKGGNTALASLMSALATYGLVTDSTTA